MSAFSLEPETWVGLGSMLGTFALTALGYAHGGRRMEDTKERVVGLSIAGGMQATGQDYLVRQAATDLTKAANRVADAVHKLANVAGALADSISHFDETTEREARDKTHERLDELGAAMRDLRKDLGKA